MAKRKGGQGVGVNGNGRARGSIQQRGPTSFRIAVYTGNADQRYLYASAKSLEEAERAKDRLLILAGKGQFLGLTRTVDDLLDHYLTTTDRLAESTRANYRWYVDKYIVPILGKMRVGDVRPVHIDAMYRRLAEKGLAPGTVIRCHTVIKSAFRQAVVWDWIDINPARDVRQPQKVSKSIRVPTDDEVRELVSVAKGDFSTYLKLAVVTGCRRGEMLGLQWSAVDWDAGKLAIVQRMVEVEPRDKLEPGTKTGANRTRRISLDAATLVLLRAHQNAQVARVAARGGELSQRTFLFTSEPYGGRPWPCNWTSHQFRETCKAAGVRGVRLHDLRHYMATKLIRAGVPIHIVSERLGHSSPDTTWKVYYHWVEGDDGGAADVMGEVFGG